MEVEEAPLTQNTEAETNTPDSIDIAPEEILQEVTEDLQHNIPIQAVDLLLEADMIDSLTDMKEVDQTNVWKICQYLLRIVYFHYEASEKEKIYNTVYTLCSRFHLWVDRLICAVVMKNDQYVIDTLFNECDDLLAKKQLCEVIAKVRLSHLLPSQPEPFSSILSSSYLSDWYEEAAKQLDIASPRLPSSILSIPSDTTGYVNGRKQAAQAIVNGLMNLGHGSEQYFRDESGRWTDGFEKNKDVGLMLAASAMGLVYMWSPYEGLNSIISLLSHTSSDVRIGASLAVGLINNGIYNPGEDISLNVLYSQLSSPGPSVSRSASSVYSASLLSLALTYANSARSDLLPFIIEGIRNGSMDTAAAASIAAGFIFCGRRNATLIREISSRFTDITAENEDSVSALMLGFGFGMMFTACQTEYANLPEVENLAGVPPRYAKYIQLCVMGCSYLGSQNIIIIHQVLEMMNREEAEITEANRQKKKEEKKETKKDSPMQSSPLAALGLGFTSPHSSVKPEEMAAKAKEDNEYHMKMMVLVIAMIAAGEHVNEEMITRTLELLLVYASKSVTEVVLLAIALLNASKPSVAIVDQIMRKTAGGGETNDSNSSSYRSCVNAVLALGIVASGSCNSKVNTHLKQVVDAERLYASISGGELAMEKAFFIHFAQGLTSLGRGLVTLSPMCEDGQVFNMISFLFLFVSVMPRLCNSSRMESSALMYLMLMLGAARPRCLMLLDHKHENVALKANMRVGQAVDTTGQAGSVRNVSGFQTLESPVLLAPGERAVMVDADEFKLGSHFLDGFIFAEEK